MLIRSRVRNLRQLCSEEQRLARGTFNVSPVSRIPLGGVKSWTGWESRMRLLVVEDDISIQQFLKRALVEAGYRVDTASTAKAAETMALEGIHDAFIIDLGLPDLDGLDLIAHCRAQ